MQTPVDTNNPPAVIPAESSPAPIVEAAVHPLWWRQRLSFAQQQALSYWFIGLCCLPMPTVALIAALVQPDFAANIAARQTLINAAMAAYMAAVTFAITALLFAYHALMVWYNPFALDDAAVVRKRRIINGISFFLSLPFVVVLVNTLIGKKNPNELGLLQTAGSNFPVIPLMLLLLLAVALAWLVHFGLVSGWLDRFAFVRLADSDVHKLWNWGRRRKAIVGAWWKRTQNKVFFFVLTIALFSTLLSEMTQTLALGIGFTAGAIAAFAQLIVIELLILLDFAVMRRRGFGWLLAALWGVQWGLGEVTSGAVVAHQPIPDWLAFIVPLESLFTVALILCWAILWIRDWRAARRRRARPYVVGSTHLGPLQRRSGTHRRSEGE